MGLVLAPFILFFGLIGLTISAIGIGLGVILTLRSSRVWPWAWPIFLGLCSVFVPGLIWATSFFWSTTPGWHGDLQKAINDIGIFVLSFTVCPGLGAWLAGVAVRLASRKEVPPLPDHRAPHSNPARWVTAGIICMWALAGWFYFYHKPRVKEEMYREMYMNEENKHREQRSLPALPTNASKDALPVVDDPQWHSSPPAVDATRKNPFINPLGMRFVPVPITGGPTGGQRVLFSVWDTRVQDYRVFVRATKRQWIKATSPAKATHPAVMVNWEDAQAFCVWLTERDRSAGRLDAKERYRLPSDHEWSCAVGIGDQEDPGASPQSKRDKLSDLFPWGTAWPPPAGAGNFNDRSLQEADPARTIIGGYQDGHARTSPVMGFAPNKFGLYDMSGNVWQWCEDEFAPNDGNRVMRGGSWGVSDRNELLSSRRYGFPASNRASTVGFRVVLAVVPAPSSVDAVASSPSLPVPVSPSLPPELAALDSEFEKLQAERVTAPFEAELAKLNIFYLGALDREIGKERAAGHQDDVAALEAEKKQITEKRAIPAIDDTDETSGITALRATYRTAHGKLTADREANLKALREPLEKRLAQMEADFTKAERLTDAKNVRDYLLVLINEGHSAKK